MEILLATCPFFRFLESFANSDIAKTNFGYWKLQKIFYWREK